MFDGGVTPAERSSSEESADTCLNAIVSLILGLSKSQEQNQQEQASLLPSISDNFPQTTSMKNTLNRKYPARFDNGKFRR